jgi:eukaryotic-like serine/threonine-protein kinase
VIADPPRHDAADDDRNRTVASPGSDPANVTPAPEFKRDQPNTSVGAYRLQRLLGSGGMGAVWLADRQDGQFSKQVALKLLHAGMAAPELRARFLQERQILASLQHPNIAALFDGGVSDDGRPFFAMEYVDGDAITHFCDRETLDVRDRVRLFLQVLRAVAHAHQRLIVHRDLKPSNVMVSADRVVKLLDFGIAKILQHADASIVTQYGDRAMTPRYAAPEQIRGEPVTVATDVYALGVTLFEVLTGRTPYLGHTGTRHDVEAAILTMEPCRPGQSLGTGLGSGEIDPIRERFERTIDTRRLRRELSGDLELIVLKALRKEASQRYPSVEAFSADLERYLDGRPILARAPTLRYRSGKWLQRHALATTAASVSVSLLVAGLVLVNQQRERATEAAARAEATQNFLIGLFEEAAPDRSGSVNIGVREILARGADRAEQELGSQQDLQRRLSGLIGRLMNDVGDFDRAEPVLRGAVAALSSQPPHDPDRLAAGMQLASTLGRVGKLAEAEQLWRSVLSEARPGTPERASAHGGLGNLLASINHFDEAAEQHRAAISIWRESAPEHARQLAGALVQSAYALQYDDQPGAASVQLVEAVSLLRALPAVPLSALGRALFQLGANQRALEDPIAARESLREAADLLTTSLGRDHLDTLSARRLLGDVLNEQGDHAAATDLLQQVLEDASRRYGENARISAEVANSLGAIDLEQGRYLAAERSFRIVTEALIAEFGERHSETGVALANLANALFEQGRFEESIQATRRSLEASEATVGADSSGQALSLFALARTQRAKGDLDGARTSIEESERKLSAVYGDRHSQTLRARHMLAAITLDQGADPATALALLDHVETHIDLDTRRGRRLRIEVLADRARALSRQGQYPAAETLLQESLAITASEYPSGHRSVAAVALELAAVQLARGNRRAARASFDHAEANNPRRQPLSAHSRDLRERLAMALDAPG